MITENLSTLKIHKLTKEQYERELDAGRIDENALYLTPDEEIDLTPYATVEQLNGKADTAHNHAIGDVDELQTALDTKVPTSRTVNDKPLTSNIRLSASDVGASETGHTHDDRYYTESEIDTKLSGKADSVHSHDDLYYTETEIDTKLSGKADTAHNHDSEYADIDHNHDGIYALYDHNHDNKYDGKGTASSIVSTHNTATDAHNDIRVLIEDLETKLNNFLDVDNATTDQLSEVLTLISNNKGTLDSLTTTKVNVSDIINNLTTASADKVLSANQGVEIKKLIDALQRELDGHNHTVADITDLTATATELNYMDGVTSNVQEQLDTLTSNKVNKSGDTMTGDLTIKADFGSVRFNDSDGNKMSVLQASDNDHTTSIYAYPTDKSTYYERYDLPTPSTGRTSNKAYKILTSKDVTASAAELNFVEGVTHSIQTQLNDKLSLDGGTLTGNLKISKANSPTFELTASNSNGYTSIDQHGGILAITSGMAKGSDVSCIELNKPSSDLTTLAQLRTKIGGVYRDYKLYGEHNKPTASDVGLGDSITLGSVEVTLPYGNNWSDVVYGNGKFVAVAENSSVAVYSTNGITWTETAMPTSAQWKSVVYGNGKFVAVAYGTSVAAYSIDGITWEETAMPSSTNWQTAAFGNGTFIAAAFSSYKAAYSTDGITWTETTLPSSVAWYCASFGNNTFVVIANNNNKVAYSTDGITWESADMPSSANWVDVTFGNGKFVAIASSNTMVAHSADGVTWESGYMPVSTTWARVAFGNGVFAAITNNSTRTAYSTDGVDWTKAEMTLSRSWRCLTYGDGKFVAIPYGDTDATISTDGINWSTSAQVLKDVNDTDVTQTVKSALGISGASASGADVNSAVLITVEDIDTICGSTISYADPSEVVF